MKLHSIFLIGGLWLISTVPLCGQDSTNCFLTDFESKYAEIPPYEDTEKISDVPSLTITINAADTVGKISKYILGNSFPVWLGNVTSDPVLLQNTQTLAPSLIRYPGGSWADIFFWDGIPKDLPDSLVDGTNGRSYAFTPQSGTNSWPTTLNNYYSFRDNVGAQGLITINYAYARYGLSAKPAEQAAHHAANWVRYDDDRTRFWEIGNENDGPWEAGWQIDTTKNQDDQPQVITGELYGKHFKIFADSMRAAAAERGNTIYIGAQILHVNGTGSWNIADRKWNEGVFKEIGDAADFYVIHNYLYSTSAPRYHLDLGSTLPKQMIDFIRQDITDKQASPRSVAMTEWNMDAPDQVKTSIINGMQATITFCEMIRLGYGMSCRWPLANWEADGMLYKGNNTAIPAWTPRPDFYYTYFLQKYLGDHLVGSVVTGKDSIDVLAYASHFESGHAGIVIVNKGLTERIINLVPENYGYGDRFYIYSLTGGTDNGEMSQQVFVNGNGPAIAVGGPIATLGDIPARAYSTSGEIKFASPGRSVQFILLEPGTNTGVNDRRNHEIIDKFMLEQNYPNPFNPQTTISYSLPQVSTVSLKVYDVMGREITTLVHNERKPAGNYEASFDATSLPSGIYFYTLRTERFVETKKMALVK